TLTDLFPGINFFALDQQNAVAFIDDEKIYTKIADVVKELDTKRVTVVRKLKFVQPADINTPISSFLTDNGGTLEVDERTNSLIITASAEVINKVDEVLEHLDCRIPQVLIEAVVASVQLSNAESLGIEWQYIPSLKFINENLRFGTDEYIKMNIGSTANVGATLRFAVVNFADPNNPLSSVGDLQGLLNALAQYTSVNVIASPKVVVLDNKEATIDIGQEFPTYTIEKDPVTGQPYQIPSTQRVPITLTVTPHVGDDNIIELEVNPQIDIPAGKPTSTGQVPVSSSSANTKVLIQDGYTLIIGGLIQGSEDVTVSKVPVLGDIPVLGNLFKTKTTNRVNNETLIFITPRIIRPEAYVAQMEDEKAKYPLLSDYVVDFNGPDQPIGIEKEKIFLNLNTANFEELKKIPGIDEAIAKLIVAYREKYGNFRQLEDLLLVPGVNEDIYRLARPYLYVVETKVPKERIPQVKPEEKEKVKIPAEERKIEKPKEKIEVIKPVEKKETITKVNLNTAQLKELETIPGLTKFEAMLIIAYRDEYGLYKKVEDVYNVPGIDKESHPELTEYLYIEEPKIEVKVKPQKEERVVKEEKIKEEVKVNINKAEYTELMKTLGISEYQARMIVAYRDSKGSFKKNEGLLNVPGIDEELYNKIKDKITVD
ncbi:MAG: helix-hairpin-helix domain-containing protein, partial [Candidatus Hydrogenedentota bacterium]